MYFRFWKIKPKNYVQVWFDKVFKIYFKVCIEKGLNFQNSSKNYIKTYYEISSKYASYFSSKRFQK